MDSSEILRLAAICGIAAAFGAFLFFLRGRGKEEALAMRNASQTLARQFSLTPSCKGLVLTGSMRGAAIEVALRGSSSRPASTIRSPLANSEISFTKHGVFDALPRAASALRGVEAERRDLTTGDVDFDAALVVQGPEAALRSVLTAEIRSRIRAAIDRGIVIRQGRLELGGLDPISTLQIANATEEVAILSSALNYDESAVAAGLAAQVQKEPLPDVRLQCLRCLLTLDGARTQWAPTLRAAQRDEDWRVSTMAAEALGDEGLPHLIKALQDDAAPDPPRLLALDALVRTATPGVFQPILRGLVSDISYDVRRKAQQAIGAAKDLAAIPLLLDRVERAAGWEMASLAEAFGMLGDPAGLRPLRRFLANSEAGAVAAKWLGEIGELEDVERLRAWIGETDRSRDDAREAQQAIARIQARLGGDAGGLAITDAPADAGAVSIPDAEAGALSTPPARPNKQST